MVTNETMIPATKEAKRLLKIVCAINNETYPQAIVRLCNKELHGQSFKPNRELKPRSAIENRRLKA